MVDNQSSLRDEGPTRRPTRGATRLMQLFMRWANG